MSQVEFELLASRAAEGIFSFADFTRRTEDIFSSSADAVALERYQAAWFELEIVNATALAEWESDGRPAEWTEPWRVKYQADALETLKMVREAAAELWPQD